MFVPTHFGESDLATLKDAMERFPHATLVTRDGDALMAAHIPMLHDSGPAPLGTLVCHVARANPLWQNAHPAREALAIFAGPDAYVSPAWYEASHESGRVVPTWNYVAVHAYGLLRAFEDPERLRALVAKLTARHEAGFAEPWSVNDAPAEYIDSMLGAIVGLEMTVTRIIGNWKLSQNRSAADRLNVEQHLLASSAPRARETGDEMRRLRKRQAGPADDT